MVFLWLFLRRDGRWSYYYYYYYLAGLVGVVVVMCFANESGKCHKLRGVLLFSGVWVDNQTQQLGVCIASPSYFLSSLWRMAAVDSPVIQFSYLVQTGGRHSKMGSRIEHEHEHEKEKENDQRHGNVTCARAPCVSVSASECPVASVSLCVSVRESGMTTMTWIAASMKWMGTNECECETGGGGSPAPQRCGGLLRQQTDLPGGSGSGSGSVWQVGAGIG